MCLTFRFFGGLGVFANVCVFEATRYQHSFSFFQICAWRSSLIFRPHRSTTYVDAVYCYRLSSVVCRSVCRSVTVVSPAKTAHPIKMPFGLRTWVVPRNHVLDVGPDRPIGRAIFRVKDMPRHARRYIHCRELCKNG